MDKTTQTLLDILKVTLMNKQVTFSIEDPKKLYNISKENGLSGSIFESILNQIEDKDVLDRFRKDFFMFVSDDEKKLNLIDRISSLFDSYKIDHIYLKGSSIKEAYPKTYMRSMGDIDVLVRESDFDNANRVLMENGFIMDSQGPVHNVFFFGDIEVELHRKLIQEVDKQEFTILANIWDYSHLINDTNWSIDTEYEIIYLLYHIRKHLLSSGVGLRNILDIGIYLKHFTSMSFEVLRTGLESTGLTRLYSNILMFNEKYLDIDLSKYYFEDIEFNEDLFESFTEYIIRSGVHGLGYGFNQFVARFAKDEKQHIGKRKSILKFLFPPYSFMKAKYPKMMKYKMLLPFAWLRRIIRFVFRGIRRIFAYLHLIRTADNLEISKTSDLFKKLGI